MLPPSLSQFQLLEFDCIEHTGLIDAVVLPLLLAFVNTDGNPDSCNLILLELYNGDWYKGSYIGFADCPCFHQRRVSRLQYHRWRLCRARDVDGRVCCNGMIYAFEFYHIFLYTRLGYKD